MLEVENVQTERRTKKSATNKRNASNDASLHVACINQSFWRFFFSIRARTHSKTRRRRTQTQFNTHWSFFNPNEFYFSHEKSADGTMGKLFDKISIVRLIVKTFSQFNFSFTRFSSRNVRACDVVYTETQVALVALENRTCIFFFFADSKRSSCHCHSYKRASPDSSTLSIDRCDGVK